MTYTPEQYAALLDKFGRGLPKALTDALLLATNEVKGEIEQRIFNKGISTDGSKIGSYSTTPMLVGAKSFPTKGDANKFFSGGGLEWRKVKGKNLAILDSGYAGLRRISGLRTDTVDMVFKGDLQRSVRRERDGKGFKLIIKGDDNVAKARGNEKHFGKGERGIFGAGKAEQQLAEDTYNEVISDYIKAIFK